MCAMIIKIESRVIRRKDDHLHRDYRKLNDDGNYDWDQKPEDEEHHDDDEHWEDEHHEGGKLKKF